MAASPDDFRGQARLLRFATPLRYDLRLRPDLTACAFSGTAAIDVAVSAPTRFLVLNAAELAVDPASIRFQARAPISFKVVVDPLLCSIRDFSQGAHRFCVLGLLQDLAPSEVVQFEEDEILVMGFDRELLVGEGVLKMDFTGTLNDQMRGFYRRYAGFVVQINTVWLGFRLLA
jgi:puromycin-sensitive aminopeptidase